MYYIKRQFCPRFTSVPFAFINMNIVCNKCGCGKAGGGGGGSQNKIAFKVRGQLKNLGL